jgi:exodeoxyribonuclease X
MLLFIDTETTGVGKDDKVVEVAWKLTDDLFGELASDFSLINPMRPIPSVASAVHGIVNSDVEFSPTLEDYMRKALLKMDSVADDSDLIFVAHNSIFDWRFLSRFFPGVRQLCTLKLARKVWPDLESHKLSVLAYELGLRLDHDRFHSAEGDVQVLYALLVRIHVHSGLSIEQLIEMCGSAKMDGESKIPFGKHKGTKLKDLPKGYVQWLLKNADSMDAELRSALESL